jgi:hypothetical protein
MRIRKTAYWFLRRIHPQLHRLIPEWLDAFLVL